MENVLTPFLQLLFYGAVMATTIHVAMIGYHWYAYTHARTLAHIVVLSYALLAFAALATIGFIAFL
jgi:hypothetical protein